MIIIFPRLKIRIIPTFNAKSVFLENLGSSLVVHLEIKGVSLVAQFNRNTNVEIDQEMTIIIDMMQSHFFNSESGKLI